MKTSVFSRVNLLVRALEVALMGFLESESFVRSLNPCHLRVKQEPIWGKGMELCVKWS